MTRDLFLQVIFVVLALWIIGWGRWNDTLRGLGMSTLLCFVVPACLLYLWLHFGVALDDVIKCRAEAWRLLSQMGVAARASAFNDGAFVDGWFLCFRPDEHAINPNFRAGNILFFCTMYGPLIAAAHACAIQLLVLGAQSFAPPAQSFAVWTVATRSFPWLALVVLVVSHLQFRFGGRNPNWMQPLVGVLALGVLGLISRV